MRQQIIDWCDNIRWKAYDIGEKVNDKSLIWKVTIRLEIFFHRLGTWILFKKWRINRRKAK